MPPFDSERYSRQTILPTIGVAGQERLAQAKVLIAGCGALGSAQAELLVRAGVGMVRLVDRDVVEWSNLQRQHLFTESDVEQRVPKAIAAHQKLQAINSHCLIESVVADINPSTILSLLQGTHLVLDGLDNFETRYLLNDACVQEGIPWIYGAVQGTTALSMPILPNQGPCFRCVFPEAPAPGTIPTCNISGVLGTAVSLAASLQVTHAIRWITQNPSSPLDFPITLTQWDLWTQKSFQLKPSKDPQCPCCSLCEYPFLGAKYSSQTRALCGRNAIQVSPPADLALNLPDLHQRITHFAQSTLRGELLEIIEPPYRLLIFPNGRTLVHGTTDPSQARALITKYIGS